MNKVKMIEGIIIVVGIILQIYVLADLFIKNSKLKKGRITAINNTKYIVSIVALIVLFIAYGLLRNFI